MDGFPHVRGDTSQTLNTATIGTVHPHVRGEYITADYLMLHRSRFTPTCVGNTPRAPVFHLPMPVPPRAWGIRQSWACTSARGRFTPLRGEYYAHLFRTQGSDGSPPRAWGILHQEYLQSFADRFTPRAWGILRFFQYKGRCTGSPPRAWGIHRGNL